MLYALILKVKRNPPTNPVDYIMEEVETLFHIYLEK